MDNNQAPIAGGAPEPNQVNNVVAGQPVAQPMAQPVAQPVQPLAGGAPAAKKKNGLIIGCIVGGVAVVALVVVLLVVFLGRGGEKTVACTGDGSALGMDLSSYGMSAKVESVFKVKDGGFASSTMKANFDLSNMSGLYKSYESMIAEQATSSVKALCGDHCKFDSSYDKGSSLQFTLEFDETGTANYIGTGGAEKNMSAQEIVDKLTKESYGMTCTQK